MSLSFSDLMNRNLGTIISSTIPENLRHLFPAERIREIGREMGVTMISQSDPFLPLLIVRLKSEVNEYLRLANYNIQEGWE